ncbi:MAG: oligosaccharide flippase family protein [Roseovarius sp.]
MLRTLLSPFAIGVASRIVAQVSAFVLILVASRALGLAEFGSYAIASALSVIFTTLVYTGVYQLILRTRDLPADRDTLFALQFAIGAAGTLIMAVIGLSLGNLADRGTAYALVGLAPIPLLASFSAWLEAHLVREGRVRTTAILVLMSELVALATAVGMFHAGYGIEALILSRLASMAFILVLYAALVRIAPKPKVERATARRGLTEAWPLWGSATLGMLSNYGADLILGAFLNPTAVGAYRAGSRIANTAADVVTQPMGIISWAQFARQEAANNQSRIRTLWKNNVALCFALLAPAMISVSILAAEIVSVLLDPSWSPAVTIISILAIARLADSLSFLLEPTLTCLGRGKQQFFVRVGDALLLVLLLLSIGWQSPEAAALAVLVRTYITMVVSLALMMRAAGITLSDLVTVTLPGLGLTALCLSVILLVGLLPLAAGSTALLVATATAELVAWSLCFALLLRSRVLVMPAL